MNKNAYKINIINFNELFDFLSLNKLNKKSLIIKKENLLNIKISKIKYLYSKYENIILEKLTMIDSKKNIIYNEEIKLFTKNKKSLEEKEIEEFCNQINGILNITENEKKLLKEKIKLKIKFELKNKFLNKLQEKYNLISPIKDPVEKIIDILIINKKEEYYKSELTYYIKKIDLLEEKIHNRLKEILETIDKIYDNCVTNSDIDKELSNLDIYSLELDIILNKFEIGLNDIN